MEKPSAVRSKKLFFSGSSSVSAEKNSSSAVAAGSLPPAPFIRISHFPKASSNALCAASTLAGSVTSTATAIASPPIVPISSTSASARESVRFSTATFAPQRARALQNSRHRTPAPPVTTATLPEKSGL